MSLRGFLIVIVCQHWNSGSICRLIGTKKGHPFQFKFTSLGHSAYITFHITIHSASHATCHSANSFRLLPSPYQVTEKQFSTQFSWKDKVNKHLRIIQSFTCIYIKKLNDCFFQSRQTAFWTEGPHIRLKVLVLWFFTLIAAIDVPYNYYESKLK